MRINGKMFFTPALRSLLCWVWLLGFGLCGLNGVQAAIVVSTPIRVVDDSGTAVRLLQAPQRIVSLLPSLTETVCDLGACDRLVATDRWSNWPASVQALPKLGGMDDPQLEAIVALRPDLVLLATGTRLAPRLRALGLPVAELYSTDLPRVQHVMRQVAALLGQPQKAAERWQALQAQIASAQQQWLSAKPHRQHVRVYFEVSTTPFAASESSYIGQLLAQLGVRNVVPASLGPFPQINPEFVVRANPTLIMVSAQEAQGMAQRPGWRGIQAIRSGHVCKLNAAQMDVLARPGPRLGQAAMVLAQCLQHRGQP